MNDSLQAISTLNSIPIEFDLTDEKQSVHDLYEDLFDILLSNQSDSTGLDSLQITALQDIVVNNNNLPAIFARNILVTNRLINYSEPIFLPENLKQSPAWEYKKPEPYHKSLINVFPNPADDYFIIEYDLQEFAESSSIIVSDMSGKLISSFSLKDKQNQRIVETNNYPTGIYVIQLLENNELIESKKVTILK